MLMTSNLATPSQATAESARVASVVAVAGHSGRSLAALAGSIAPGLATVDETTPVGVAASLDGRSVLVGNAAFLKQLDVSLAALGDGPERLRRRGEHVVFVSIDGQIAGYFGLIPARA